MKDETTLASVDNIIETVKEITEYQYIEEDTREMKVWRRLNKSFLKVLRSK